MLCITVAVTASITLPLAAQTQPIVVKDDNGRTVRVPRPATRIISLIPSATETLIALGLANQIVGRTVYDTASNIRHAVSVGGGLEPNLEVILSLRPDLVISWAAQKRQGIQERLLAAGIPVFDLATQDTTDILRGIANMGRLTGKNREAAQLAASIHADFASARSAAQGKRRLKALFLVSSDPPIIAGPNTYVGQVISIAGGEALFPELQRNWPTVSLEEIAKRNPDVIIMAVGEFRLNALARLQATPGWRDLPAVRNKRVITIDADITNRPGAKVGQFTKLVRDSLQAHRIP